MKPKAGEKLAAFKMKDDKKVPNCVPKKEGKV